MQVVIIRERVASSCNLLEAVQQLADVDASAAYDLLQLGAVNFGQQFKVLQELAQPCSTSHAAGKLRQAAVMHCN